MSEMPNDIPDEVTNGNDENLSVEKLKQEVAALEEIVGGLRDLNLALDQIEPTTSEAGQDVILGEVFK